MLNIIGVNMELKKYRFDEITVNFDRQRIPLSSMERENRKGTYRYFGAQGVIDYIDDYIFDGEYLLIAEDGENLKSKKQKIGQIVTGRFWVNNHAHIVQGNQYCRTKYLYYLINLIDISGFITGSAQPKLSQSNMNRIEFYLPSIEIQDVIISILNSIDKKIELNRKINENLLEQAKTLFKSWFVDFEPFNESMVLSPAGIPVPKSLKMVQIQDLPHLLETGKRPKGGAVPEGVPSVGAENVKSLGIFDASSTKYIPLDFAASMKRGKIEGYELLLYKDGGKPGTFTPHFSMFGEGFPYKEFYINEHVFKLDFFNRGFNEFAYLYLQTDYPYHWLANNGGKAAIPGINQQDVNSIWIYHPDHPQVQDFCTWIQPLFTSILTNCAQNMKLSRIRDTLLPKLMTGEIDVSSLDI